MGHSIEISEGRRVNVADIRSGRSGRRPGPGRALRRARRPRRFLPEAEGGAEGRGHPGVRRMRCSRQSASAAFFQGAKISRRSTRAGKSRIEEGRHGNIELCSGIRNYLGVTPDRRQDLFTVVAYRKSMFLFDIERTGLQSPRLLSLGSLLCKLVFFSATSLSPSRSSMQSISLTLVPLSSPQPNRAHSSERSLPELRSRVCSEVEGPKARRSLAPNNNNAPSTIHRLTGRHPPWLSRGRQQHPGVPRER